MIPHNRWSPRDEYVRAAERVIASGWVAQGPEVAAFEEELAARFRPGGAAACVSSGTAALMLALVALNASRVTLPTYSCVALAQACELAGVLWSPADSFEHTDVVVHHYGAPEHGVMEYGIVEDFTHAPGATISGRPCGSFGHASVISFGATKPLGVGSGGAVLGDVSLIETIRHWRDYDRVERWRGCFNWQWSDVPAAIARERLRRLDVENAQRRAIAEVYGGSSDSKDPERVWYRFIHMTDDVERSIAFFAERRVEVINPLRPGELLHRRLRFPDSAFPFATRFAEHSISLPCWPGMPMDVMHAVGRALAEHEGSP